MRALDHTPDADVFDQVSGLVAQYRYSAHEKKLYRRYVQPERDLILQRNAELRKNKGVIRDLSFARQQLSIPKLDYYLLCKKYPVILNGDADQQLHFWKRFIQTSESEIYRVQ